MPKFMIITKGPSASEAFDALLGNEHDHTGVVDDNFEMHYPDEEEPFRFAFRVMNETRKTGCVQLSSDEFLFFGHGE